MRMEQGRDAIEACWIRLPNCFGASDNGVDPPPLRDTLLHVGAGVGRVRSVLHLNGGSGMMPACTELWHGNLESPWMNHSSRREWGRKEDGCRVISRSRRPVALVVEAPLLPLFLAALPAVHSSLFTRNGKHDIHNGVRERQPRVDDSQRLDRRTGTMLYHRLPTCLCASVHCTRLLH